MKLIATLVLIFAMNCHAQDAFEFECMKIVNNYRGSVYPVNVNLSNELKTTKQPQKPLVWNQFLANDALKSTDYFRKNGMAESKDTITNAYCFYLQNSYQLTIYFTDMDDEVNYYSGKEVREWANNSKYTKIGVGWSYQNSTLNYRYVCILLR